MFAQLQFYLFYFCFSFVLVLVSLHLCGRLEWNSISQITSVADVFFALGPALRDKIKID